MKCSRSMPVRTLAFLLFLGVFGVASKACALELALDVSGCPELPEKRVQELMELELTAQVARPAAAARSAALVSISCNGDEVLIRVTDSTTSKVVTRTFTLTEREPDVRARAVALAAAELVITSWMELVLTNPPERAQPAPAWVNENRRAATAVAQQHTRQGTRVDALFPFASFGGTFHAHPGTWGGGLRLSLVWGAARFGVDSDLSVTLDDDRTSLGDVRTNTWSLGLRPALRFETGRWLGSIGIGARLGLARIEGSAADPSTIRGHVVAGTWGGPLAHANFGVSCAHLKVRLGVEGGYASKSVSGSVEGQARAGVSGPWFSTTLGFGWGA
jgi:hypothetical protein